MRLFILVIAVIAHTILLNPRSGPLHFLLWLPKLLADALSPVLVGWHTFVVLMGLKRRDWVLLLLGGMGTAVSLKHFTDVTTPQENDFTEAFGLDWQARIPAEIQANLSTRRWQPLFKQAPHGLIEWDVEYGSNPDTPDDVRLFADIMHPPDHVARSGLALIYVHGGGWAYGKRNIGKFPYFRQLSAQGHLIMDIDYTLNPKTSVPGMAMDVKRAIIWLKTNAERYQINPERVVLAGQSAGGHLSLLAAYTGNYPGLQPDGSPVDTAVRAVISYYGPPDMAALHDDVEARFTVLLKGQMGQSLQERAGHEHTLAHGIAGLVGGSVLDAPEMYRLISPITYVDAECPPTLLIHGTHDLLVSYREVERLLVALRQHDVPSVYIPLPGCDHSFESVLPRISPSAQTSAYYMERFIALMV
ncbi:MAG: alpha/beta hydrolase [Anaerolineae bacterium]|nr:alpha/beta hydrolase [Anaerolineae bacterium]